jgi:DNA-binding transcriptional ArsR family regulator
MSDRVAKNALFDAFASVAQALGSGRRAEIVDVLAQGERSVDEVAGEIGQSLANTSHHLRLLAKSGLVRSRREGARVVYRLASDRVADLWAAVRDVAAHHVAEVSVLAGEYLGDRNGIEQVSADELAERVERGQVVVLDVRPQAENGPYCVYADDAVRLLQARGVRARRLDVGFPEWRRAGLPVEGAA